MQLEYDRGIDLLAIAAIPGGAAARAAHAGPFAGNCFFPGDGVWSTT